MKTIELTEQLPCPVTAVWDIIGDVSRADWVPAVDNISLEGDMRSFVMAGVGEVQEQILLNDGQNHRLQYTAVKTPVPLEHHLATITLSEQDGQCLLHWTTEVAPGDFAPAIEQAMQAALADLKQVLANPD